MTITDADRHTIFRGYEYRLHKHYDDKEMAQMEASLCRHYGMQTAWESKGKTRACVRQLSNGRWGVYTTTF
jgi:hypothetical protein